MVRSNLRRHNRAGSLPFHFTQMGRWWIKQQELDILAAEPSRRRYLAGEYKFKRTPMSRQDMIRAKAKLETLSHDGIF